MTPRPASVETELEVEAWQLWALDFEPDMACDLIVEVSCVAGASWLLICPACDTYELACTCCLERARRVFANVQLTCDCGRSSLGVDGTRNVLPLGMRA